MKSWLRILVFLLCLGLAVSACRPTGTSTGSKEPSPILTSPIPVSVTDGGMPTEPRPTSCPTQTPSLTSPPSPIPPPTAVPWGGQLVFSSLRPDAGGQGVTSHLYTIDLADETGAITQLTFGDNDDAYPSWSPSGDRIAFASGRGGKGNYDLFIINADGSGLLQLTDTPEDEIEPVWSPDGAQIAYIEITLDELGLQERRLHLISVSSGISEQLTYGPGNDWYPDWSPGGRYLAFDRIELGGNSSVYLWVEETGSITRLELPGESPGTIEYDYPRWLPSEGNLLSLVRNEYGSDTVVSQIVVLEVEERAGEIILHQMPAAIETNFAHYTWGPGGEWLIAPVRIWTAGPQTYNLFRVRVSLTKKSRACWQCTGLLDEAFLTEGDYYDDFPDWTP
jgi:dipeptidyl aminopeptidase/acylaminoacyl peptidase